MWQSSVKTVLHDITFESRDTRSPYLCFWSRASMRYCGGSWMSVQMTCWLQVGGACLSGLQQSPGIKNWTSVPREHVPRGHQTAHNRYQCFQCVILLLQYQTKKRGDGSDLGESLLHCHLQILTVDIGRFDIISWLLQVNRKKFYHKRRLCRGGGKN